MNDWTDDNEVLKNAAPEVSGLLKLLANEQRLQLLCHMRAGGEVSVGDLAALTGLPQGGVSQHLARMREGQLVATRRDARTIYYRISDPHVLALMGFLCDTFGRERATTMQEGAHPTSKAA